jgi:hypothetical protein
LAQQASAPAAPALDGPGPAGHADDRDVAALLSAFDPRFTPVMTRLRRLVTRAVPGATERVIAGWKVVAYDAGGLFCYLKPTREAEIQVGFYDGVRLDDPDGRLEGRGKRRRFVRVPLEGPVDDAALLPLIQRAAALASAA